MEKWVLLRPTILLYVTAVAFSVIFVGVALATGRWEPMLGVMLLVASFMTTLRGHRRRLRAIDERDPSITKGYGLLTVAWLILVAGIYLPWPLMQLLET
ncbi:MAG: hypothetical protein ACRCTR_01915 [Actinomycetota bacterium]